MEQTYRFKTQKDLRVSDGEIFCENFRTASAVMDFTNIRIRKTR